MKMNLNDLENKLKKSIEEEKFTPAEIMGFITEPNLALLAGACIGYKLAMADFKNKLEEINAKVTQLPKESGRLLSGE